MNRKFLLGAIFGIAGMMAACNNTCSVDGTGTIVPGSADDFAANIPNTVYFDFDKSNVSETAQKRVDAQACWLKTYSATTATVEGHCDSRGTAEYNMALGQQRANSVKKALEAQGIDASRLTTVSYGKERLVDTGTTEASHAANRRTVTAINQ